MGMKRGWLIVLLLMLVVFVAGGVTIGPRLSGTIHVYALPWPWVRLVWVSPHREDPDREAAMTQSEMNLRACGAAKNAELALQRLTERLVVLLQKEDEDADLTPYASGPFALDTRSAVAHFNDVQAAWRTFLTESVNFDGWFYAGGSMRPLIVCSAAERMTEQRISELERLERSLRLGLPPGQLPSGR